MLGGDNAPVPTPSDQLRPDMLLYAFQNSTVDINDGQFLIPVKYVATIRIATADQDSITAVGTFVADQDEFDKKQSTWTLYERMPTDSHDLFRKVAGIDKDPCQLVGGKILSNRSFSLCGLYGCRNAGQVTPERHRHGLPADPAAFKLAAEIGRRQMIAKSLNVGVLQRSPIPEQDRIVHMRVAGGLIQFGEKNHEMETTK